MIDWKLIAEMPEEMKDGRKLLFLGKHIKNTFIATVVAWETWENLGASLFTTSESGMPLEKSLLTFYTHYVELNASQEKRHE